MLTSTSIRWLVVAVSAAMVLAVVAACLGFQARLPKEPKTKTAAVSLGDQAALPYLTLF